MLPSNLKALFRPVAMMVPDYRLIAEVSLYANGYRDAAALAINLVSVLKVGRQACQRGRDLEFSGSRWTRPIKAGTAPMGPVTSFSFCDTCRPKP